MPSINQNYDNTSETDHVYPKVQPRGRGRRANKIDEMENPLGSFLQNKIEFRGITQTAFARLLGISRDKVIRLLSKASIEIEESLVVRIIQVLELNNTEQEEFRKLQVGNKWVEPLLPALPEEVNNVAPTPVSEGAVWLSIPSAETFDLLGKSQDTAEEKHTGERGRKAAGAQTAIGRFLEEQLQSKGMKRSDLAKAIDMNQSTITRLIEGKTAIRQGTREQIGWVLGLNEAERYEFESLIPQLQKGDISIHKFSHIDFEYLVERLRELHGYYERGLAEYVSLISHEFYLQLKRMDSLKNEKRAIDLQWRFGMLNGSANEAVLALNKRALPMIEFYNTLQRNIESKGVLPKQSEIYIAHIQTRRAPLYREVEKYRNSVEEFTRALGVYTRDKEPPPEDRRLTVELYYSRAHVYAVQGMKTEWRRDIQLARIWADGEKDEKRHRELVGLVDYTEGEGYKRLAFNEERSFSKETKEGFALKGLRLFKISHMEESRWVGHRLLNQVARLQCLALIDPEAALKEAGNLRTEAEQRYPSIVPKVDQIISYARKRLF